MGCKFQKVVPEFSFLCGDLMIGRRQLILKVFSRRDIPDLFNCPDNISMEIDELRCSELEMGASSLAEHHS